MSAAKQEPWRHIEEIRSYVHEGAAAIERALGVTAADVLGRSRLRDLVQPRWVLMWRARRHSEAHGLGWTLVSIAKVFRRDHSDVLRGVRRVDVALTNGDAWAVDLLAKLNEGLRATA